MASTSRDRRDPSCIVLFAVISLIAVAVSVVVIIVITHSGPSHPPQLDFSITGFSVSSLSITSYNVSSEFNIKFTIRRDAYSRSPHFDFNAVYKHINHTDQRRKSSQQKQQRWLLFSLMPITAGFLNGESGKWVATGEYVGDGAVVIEGVFVKRGFVNLKLEVWAFDQSHTKWTVVCDQIRVVFNNATAVAATGLDGRGSMVGQSKLCQIDHTLS